MSKWKEYLLDLGLLWVRIGMGLGIARHGFQKIFEGKMAGFAGAVGSLGFPAPEFFAWAAALSELLGGVLIVLGLFTRPAAFFVFATMTVAAFLHHAGDPLSSKELALAYWLISGMVLMTGGGKWSVDAKMKLKVE